MYDKQSWKGDFFVIVFKASLKVSSKWVNYELLSLSP
jgi:hypothetical protein